MEYYHVVFTLSASISAIAWYNTAVVYGLLFDIAAEPPRTVAADPRLLGDRSAPRRCCTAGAQRSCITRACTVSFPVAACRPMVSGGSPAGSVSFCRCTCSRGCCGAASLKQSQTQTEMARCSSSATT